jgi:hypothetical protein
VPAFESVSADAGNKEGECNPVGYDDSTKLRGDGTTELGEGEERGDTDETRGEGKPTKVGAKGCGD